MTNNKTRGKFVCEMRHLKLDCMLTSHATIRSTICKVNKIVTFE